MKLKKLRQEKKVSQEEMSRTLGITLRSYQNKENATSKFYINEVIAIADKLEIDIKELL